MATPKKNKGGRPRKYTAKMILTQARVDMRIRELLDSVDRSTTDVVNACLLYFVRVGPKAQQAIIDEWDELVGNPKQSVKS